MKRRPADFRSGTGLAELTRLFDAVAATMPEPPQVRASVEEIDGLRTTWITRGPTTWPVELKKLPWIFGDCLRGVARLDVGDVGPALTGLGALPQSRS